MWPFKTKTQILLEQIDFLRAQVAQLQNAALAIQLAPTQVPSAPMSGPEVEEPGMRLYSTELEEDIEHALQAGQIDEETAELILAAEREERGSYQYE